MQTSLVASYQQQYFEYAGPCGPDEFLAQLTSAENGENGENGEELAAEPAACESQPHRHQDSGRVDGGLEATVTRATSGPEVVHHNPDTRRLGDEQFTRQMPYQTHGAIQNHYQYSSDAAVQHQATYGQLAAVEGATIQSFHSGGQLGAAPPPYAYSAADGAATLVQTQQSVQLAERQPLYTQLAAVHATPDLEEPPEGALVYQTGEHFLGPATSLSQSPVDLTNPSANPSNNNPDSLYQRQPAVYYDLGATCAGQQQQQSRQESASSYQQEQRDGHLYSYHSYQQTDAFVSSGSILTEQNRFMRPQNVAASSEQHYDEQACAFRPPAHYFADGSQAPHSYQDFSYHEDKHHCELHTDQNYHQHDCPALQNNENHNYQPDACGYQPGCLAPPPPDQHCDGAAHHQANQAAGEALGAQLGGHFKLRNSSSESDCDSSSGSASGRGRRRRRRHQDAGSTSAATDLDSLDWSPTRDEKRAREANIQLSYHEIVNLPIDQFNEHILRVAYSEAQLNLMKDIRRRGKNKVAAQMCRKRKMEQIQEVQLEVGALVSRRLELLYELDMLRQHHEKLNAEFGRLHSLVQSGGGGASQLDPQVQAFESAAAAAAAAAAKVQQQQTEQMC